MAFLNIKYPDGIKKIDIKPVASNDKDLAIKDIGYIPIVGQTRHEFVKLSNSTWSLLDETPLNLPYDFYGGAAVVCRNRNGYDEIHILGSSLSSNYKKHYKWDGVQWVVASTLPYDFFGIPAVVRNNNEIHILGNTGSNNKHYILYYGSGSWTLSSDTPPCPCANYSAVVLNNEIHKLGGLGYVTSHYKWNGSTWTEESVLPHSFYNGAAVVYNNEIHILGGGASSSDYKKHYKWNSVKRIWTEVSTLPYYFKYGAAVVYNNEIHILGSDNSSNYKYYHYKWDGNSWSRVSKLPYPFSQGSAVIFNKEINILGTQTANYRTKHYRFDEFAIKWKSGPVVPYNFMCGCAVSTGSSSFYIFGGGDSISSFSNYIYLGLSSSFVSSPNFPNLPINFGRGQAVKLGSEFHILGGYSSYTAHYKWSGTTSSTWTEVSTLPYRFYGGAAVVYNNEIHILGGGYTTSYYKKHYKWNGSTWTEVSTLPFNFVNGAAVVYNNEIHILKNTSHYKWNGSTWTEVSTLPYKFMNGAAVIYLNEIHILGGSYVSSDYTSHYKWNGYTWTEVSTLPYRFYYGAAVSLASAESSVDKIDEIHILGGGGNKTAHYVWNVNDGWKNYV